jgi:hypothetical protein
VVAWYRDADYNFLALTDHDLLTLPADYRSVAGHMLLVHGEEVTAGDVHVNALGIGEALPPIVRDTARDTLQANVDAIREAGGVASVNHPNFRWQVRPLFEVHNAGPEVNNAGGRPGHPSTEEMWDHLLSAGHRWFGIAVDDAHFFRVWGRQYSNPGRGWVCIRAERLDEPSLLTALESGDCYASTGVELVDIAFDRTTLAIDIAPRWDLEYRTAFIGREGRVLEVASGLEPRYRVSGSEGYVRARVDDSDGLTAWVQPQFVG